MRRGESSPRWTRELLIVKLLYGAGLRLLEALQLRVKDVDFERGQLTVRDPKWKHDRVTMLPAAVTPALNEQLVHAKLLHEEDLAAGFGRVWLPDALERKFPSAPADWKWQWVFPAPTRWKDANGGEGRHHYHETNVQRAVTRAARAADIDPPPRRPRRPQPPRPRLTNNRNRSLTRPSALGVKTKGRPAIDMEVSVYR